MSPKEMNSKSSLPKRTYSRVHPDQRRDELIAATLRLIASKGVRSATVRAIAEEAKVTPGLIRHYFLSKEELISSAYECHMSKMIEDSESTVGADCSSAVQKLAGFITGSLTPPVVDRRGVALWAGLFQLVLHDRQMRETHEKTYIQYRNRIEMLIAQALAEEGKPASKKILRRYAIASNAVIDGLWLEGGALAEAFKVGELAEIGLDTIGALLGLELSAPLGSNPGKP